MLASPLGTHTASRFFFSTGKSAASKDSLFYAVNFIPLCKWWKQSLTCWIFQAVCSSCYVDTPWCVTITLLNPCCMLSCSKAGNLSFSAVSVSTDSWQFFHSPLASPIPFHFHSLVPHLAPFPSLLCLVGVLFICRLALYFMTSLFFFIKLLHFSNCFSEKHYKFWYII